MNAEKRLPTEWEEFLETEEASTVHQGRTQISAAEITKLFSMFEKWKLGRKV